MTKKEVAKQLRSKLSAAIRALPDDVDYQSVSVIGRCNASRTYAWRRGAC